MAGVLTTILWVLAGIWTASGLAVAAIFALDERAHRDD
jgi:hypothetical protein